MVRRAYASKKRTEMVRVLTFTAAIATVAIVSIAGLCIRSASHHEEEGKLGDNAIVAPEAPGNGVNGAAAVPSHPELGLEAAQDFDRHGLAGASAAGDPSLPIQDPTTAELQPGYEELSTIAIRDLKEEASKELEQLKAVGAKELVAAGFYEARFYARGERIPFGRVVDEYSGPFLVQMISSGDGGPAELRIISFPEQAYPRIHELHAQIMEIDAVLQARK
jgi:hypothetical protein